MPLRGVARRLVVISSQDVYRAYGRFHGKEPGPLEPLPVTEDSPCARSSTRIEARSPAWTTTRRSSSSASR